MAHNDELSPRHHVLLVRLRPLLRFARLEADTEADVLVIGAGITGLTAAYDLASAGRSVALPHDFPPWAAVWQQKTGPPREARIAC
jgi:NADPH-dependent 2,4-dienoyl-CoA reductase/sulfur reductase-like enzyme